MYELKIHCLQSSSLEEQVNVIHGNGVILRLPTHLSELRSLRSIGYKPYHLYFTSNDIPNKGDWFIVNGIVKKCVDKSKSIDIEFLIDELGNHDLIEFCEKIEVTTDKSLGLITRIMDQSSFIEMYVESNGDIKEIDVHESTYKNVVNISKVKDTFTKEEVLQLLLALADSDGLYQTDFRADQVRFVTEWFNHQLK